MKEKRSKLIVLIGVFALAAMLPAPASGVPPGTSVVKGESQGALYALYVPAN